VMEDTALGSADAAEDGAGTEVGVTVLAGGPDGVMTNVGSCDGVTNDDRVIDTLEAGDTGIPGVYDGSTTPGVYDGMTPGVDDGTTPGT
jgi:hypothetical protein